MAKILIVDDEPSILQLFKYEFEDAGHMVALAKNGREALDAVAADLPDFIVLDLAMPEMSGKEFAMEFKRLSLSNPKLCNVHIVVMTGEDFLEASLNKVFSVIQGFVCFFPKMTPPEKVVEKAEEVLSKRGNGLN